MFMFNSPLPIYNVVICLFDRDWIQEEKIFVVVETGSGPEHPLERRIDVDDVDNQRFLPRGLSSQAPVKNLNQLRTASPSSPALVLADNLGAFVRR